MKILTNNSAAQELNNMSNFYLLEVECHGSKPQLQIDNTIYSTSWLIERLRVNQVQNLKYTLYDLGDERGMRNWLHFVGQGGPK